MAFERDSRARSVKREDDIARARGVVRGRFEEYECIGEALGTVAEGSFETWIAWSAMEDASIVASALQRGRAELVAPGRDGVARLTSAVALLERLERFLLRNHA